MRRRGFLKRLGSVFAAALGVSVGDARADQGPILSRHYNTIIMDDLQPPYQGPLFKKVELWDYPLQQLMKETPFRLEAGAGVEPAISGHEPAALPLGYPADDHSSTKGGI